MRFHWPFYAGLGEQTLVGQTNKFKLLSLTCLLVAGSLIGLSVNLAKLASAAGVELMSFLIWSIAGATLIVASIALAFGQRPALNRHVGEYFLISGLLSVALPNVMYFSAAPRVGVGFVALSFAFPPLYTYVLALLGSLERFSMFRALGVALGVVGAIIISLSKSTELDADFIGMALALGAPMVIAAGNVYRTLRWPSGESSLALAPGMLLGAFFFLAIGLFVTDSSFSFPFENITALKFVLAQTLAFSAMYALYFILQRMAGPVYMSQVGSVGAISGAAIAIFVLGETPPKALPVAALFTAIAVFLVTRTASGGILKNNGPVGHQTKS